MVVAAGRAAWVVVSATAVGRVAMVVVGSLLCPGSRGSPSRRTYSRCTTWHSAGAECGLRASFRSHAPCRTRCTRPACTSTTSTSPRTTCWCRGPSGVCGGLTSLCRSAGIRPYARALGAPPHRAQSALVPLTRVVLHVVPQYITRSPCHVRTWSRRIECWPSRRCHLFPFFYA